ncbi:MULTISPECIES: YidC/Oxa1 family membrane protein insertase [Carboxydothermus]|uniref:Sporulation associated-membrane protein n=2 Tax=Carboxydothermus TaxID=129957 RepID=Q3AG58_CARHZ|nr:MULTISPECIES: YidC/Oxa1 family membrane protein insertase [Carboxydothermus]ABB14148.1 sporulation associated-membrane protein [Carboxydothermus hydrogenoformans Z-2901]NYE57596.1 YidC/Oxa1 family membrane protein insertase [Carboxydothermus ferrireducens DSM 11255]
MQPLIDAITWILNNLYLFTKSIGIPSYALAIIMLTILIKIILYPLNHAQMKSMKVMQELQPKMQEIQKKYKNDPQKQQQALMELYKEYGVNPMSGCLPMLIQLPILIALYRALYNFKYLNPAHAKFFWIANISHKDPYFILPILAALTTYIQSRMTMTSGNDPNQKVMLYVMPLMIGWIAMSLPAGLGIYWVVLNIMGIIQQYFVNQSTHKIVERGTKENAGD